MTAPLLDIRHIAKAYAGVPALKDVSLQLAHGEVHAVMGENGAGKSTLIRILAGATSPDSGALVLDEKAVTIGHPSAASRLGLRFIHQELGIIPELSVAENLFLGKPYPRRLGVLADWKALNRKAAEALQALDITTIDPARKMARLSIGDQMLVKIAAAFIDGGKAGRLYVMDEPTAALTAEDSEKLFKVISNLRAGGRSVIYVSHRLDEVVRIADRVTVLRDGETIATCDMADCSKSDIIEMMTGRTFSEAYPKRHRDLASDVVLKVSGLHSPGLHGLDFEVRAGEILGIAGLEGAGQSELLRLLIGAEKATGGEVELNGRRLTSQGTADRWNEGFAYVPRERLREGLLPRASVADNAVLSHLSDIARVGLFRRRKAEFDRSLELAKRVKLKAASPHQPVRQLSGGNQQKVVFARAVLGAPGVLLLDEPTRGVDVGAKFDIHSLLRELAGSGVAIVLASSDLPELIGMADRILVMRDGRQLAIVQTESQTQATLLSLFFGEAPTVSRGTELCP